MTTIVSVTSHAEQIEVTSIGPDMEPDSEWLFIDPFGHRHTHAHPTS